jgi:hypothetical protein
MDRDCYIITFVQQDLLQLGLGSLILFLSLNINVFKASIFNIVKELDPIGLQRCTNDMQRHREEYIVLGPDYIWSLDGHNKLTD